MDKRHGIILAKSLPAKKYKIKTGEPITDALKKCPFLEIAPPNYGLYETNSNAFMKILREYSDKVEQFSVDEAFMDMTGMELLFGSPIVAASTVKDRIRDELGFTVNIGVSTNKLLAKMAGEFNKPDKVNTLFVDELEEKLWPLPVSELYFVGRATTKKLHELGIRTIGELAGANLDMLRAHLKSHGEAIWGFSHGIDVSMVEPTPAENKGYGNSTTISFDVCDVGTAKMFLLSLAETVGKRLRRDHAKARVVAIGIKYFDFTQASHQCVLPSATNITNEIRLAAGHLFDALWNGSPIRNLGIQTSRLTYNEDNRQLSLFDSADYEKLEKLDRAIDSIRERFGMDCIQRASFVCNGRIDHMGGGITREKRTVNYNKVKVK
jgi:DNA polymerase-4